MPRGVVDIEGMNSPQCREIRSLEPPKGLPFRIGKVGHLVLRVKDLKRSVEFYTQVLGFKVSDVYPDTMMPGGMVFMRCNSDHHGVGLAGGGKGDANNAELHHIAFEVATIDEVIRARDHLRDLGVKIEFEGRRRAGCQVSVEFRDPDNHSLEIFWAMDQVGSDGHIRPPEDWREELTLEGAIKNAPPGQDTTLFDPSLLKKLR
jgi:catechol 2,3-dioxygenase